MKTLAFAVAALLLAPAAADAGTGGFVSIGVGLPTSTGGELGDWDASGKLGSVFVGQRLHPYFGVEAGLSAYGLSTTQGAAVTNVGLAAAGRLFVPVTPVITPYLRLGIEKTWMTRDRAQDFSGTGWLASLGVEYKLNLSFVSGGVWAEYTRHDASFVNSSAQRDGNIDTLSLGVTVGF